MILIKLTYDGLNKCKMYEIYLVSSKNIHSLILVLQIEIPLAEADYYQHIILDSQAKL